MPFFYAKNAGRMCAGRKKGCEGKIQRRQRTGKSIKNGAANEERGWKIQKGKQDGKQDCGKEKSGPAAGRTRRAKGLGRERKKVEEAGIKAGGGCAKDRRTICPEKRERNGRKAEREKRRLGSDTRRTKNLGREGERRAGISGINARGRTGQRTEERFALTRERNEQGGIGRERCGKVVR